MSGTYLLSSATVAGDYQIRVFDIGEAALTASANGKGTIYSPRQSLIHRLRCHDDRVKRVVTEHSPDLFLTVGEVCGCCIQVCYFNLCTGWNCTSTRFKGVPQLLARALS